MSYGIRKFWCWTLTQHTSFFLTSHVTDMNYITDRRFFVILYQPIHWYLTRILTFLSEQRAQFSTMFTSRPFYNVVWSQHSNVQGSIFVTCLNFAGTGSRLWQRLLWHDIWRSSHLAAQLKLCGQLYWATLDGSSSQLIPIMAVGTVQVSLAPDCAHLILADGRSSIQTVVEVRKRSSIRGHWRSNAIGSQVAPQNSISYTREFKYRWERNQGFEIWKLSALEKCNPSSGVSDTENIARKNPVRRCV